MTRFIETIEVRQNLSIIARERGKIVTRRDGHNIFLDLGREWLAKLIGYLSYSPDTPETNYRVKYIGFGIGGTSQLQLTQANSPPISPPYSGSNLQTDTDATVSLIERPVRVTGSSSAYPGVAGDKWAVALQTPTGHTLPTEATFKRVLAQTDVSYAPFISVPLSEVGLMTAAADPENYQNPLIAYDTFDTISKTGSLELEVVWTLRF